MNYLAIGVQGGRQVNRVWWLDAMLNCNFCRFGRYVPTNLDHVNVIVVEKTRDDIYISKLLLNTGFSVDVAD